MATIDLGDDELPGRLAVRGAGDDDCRDVASEGAGSATRFEYGWEWPTRAQWKQGQHYGFCWAPDLASPSGTGGRPRSRGAGEALEVALPVLGDLHVQVEVDRRAEHRLDLLAGVAADLAQPAAAR